MMPSDKRRPLVLVNGELEAGEKRRLQLPMRYAEALWHAGATALVLPALAASLDHLLDQAAGVVLGGGDDFDTQRLGLGPTHAAAKPVPAEKQGFDLALVSKALERDLPILGICYGMQLLGVASGARLFQHLPEDRPGHDEHAGGAQHDVLLAPDSKLREIYGVDRIEVISRHHQALATAASPWEVSARDPEGLIEAIELPSATYALGVQWHPELDDFTGPQGRLFTSFVEAAACREAASAPY